MNAHEKRARLEDLNRLLDGRTKHTPAEEMKLLYEAMGLCEDLGLDRAWSRFKALLERLNTQQIEKRRAERSKQ